MNWIPIVLSMCLVVKHQESRAAMSLNVHWYVENVKPNNEMLHSWNYIQTEQYHIQQFIKKIITEYRFVILLIYSCTHFCVKNHTSNRQMSAHRWTQKMNTIDKYQSKTLQNISSTWLDLLLLLLSHALNYTYIHISQLI